MEYYGYGIPAGNSGPSIYEIEQDKRTKAIVEKVKNHTISNDRDVIIARDWIDRNK